MAKLTAAKRRALPGKDFAGPRRSYPVENKAHARLAKAMAAKEAKAGRLSASAKKTIDARADAKLHGMVRSGKPVSKKGT